MPGLVAMSYEMPAWESVSAEEILARISSGVSVMRMRERSLLCDFDILEVGSVSDMMRCTGAAGACQLGLCIADLGSCVRIMVSGCTRQGP